MSSESKWEGLLASKRLAATSVLGFIPCGPFTKQDMDNVSRESNGSQRLGEIERVAGKKEKAK